MRNKNSFNIALLNDDQCRIEAKCFTTNNSKLADEGGNKSYIITSGSLNLSKTISNLSFQTMRVSNSMITSNRIIETQFYKLDQLAPVDLDKLLSVEVSDAEVSPNLSTNSIVFTRGRSEQFMKNLNHTPSTICNYYQQSNEVTPNKDVGKVTSSNNNKFKLDLKDIHINMSNLEYENSSSSRLTNEECTNFLAKKNPIMYTKSQLRSGDKNKPNQSPREENFSPLEKIFPFNCNNVDASLNTLTKEVRKDIIVHMSELNIEEKILRNQEMLTKTPTPKDSWDRKNLNFTFDKVHEDLLTDEKETKISSDDPIPIPEPIKNLQPKLKIQHSSNKSTDKKDVKEKFKSKVNNIAIINDKTKHDLRKPNGKDKNDYLSPPVSSTRKTYHSTNHSNYSKASYTSKYTQESRSSKYNNPQYTISNNSQIKLFLLNLLETKEGNPTYNISNNINIDKIVIQNKENNKRPKKSNSLNHDSAKSRCKDAIFNFTQQNRINFLDCKKPSLEKKNRSTSKTTNRKTEVLEYTVNLDQMSYNKMKKKVETPTNKNSDKQNQTIVSKQPSFAETKSVKTISNFSNYTKKSVATTKVDQISNSIKHIDLPNPKTKVISTKLELLLGDDVSVQADDL
jgi:hypothetical protein